MPSHLAPAENPVFDSEKQASGLNGLLSLLPRESRYRQLTEGMGTPEELSSLIASQLQDMGVRGNLAETIAPVYTALQNYRATHGVDQVNMSVTILREGQKPPLLSGKGERALIFYAENNAPQIITLQNEFNLHVHVPQGGGQKMAAQFPAQSKPGVLLQIARASAADTMQNPGGRKRKNDIENDEAVPAFEDVLQELATAEWQDDFQLEAMLSDPRHASELGRILRESGLTQDAVAALAAEPLSFAPDNVESQLSPAILQQLESLGKSSQTLRRRTPILATEQQNNPPSNNKILQEIKQASPAKDSKNTSPARPDHVSPKTVVAAVLRNDPALASKAMSELASRIVKDGMKQLPPAKRDMLSAQVTNPKQGAIDPVVLQNALQILKENAVQTKNSVLQDQLVRLDALSVAVAERFAPVTARNLSRPVLSVKDKAALISAVVSKNEPAALSKINDVAVQAVTSIVKKLEAHPVYKTDPAVISLKKIIVESTVAPSSQSVRDALATARTLVASKPEFRPQAALLSDVSALRVIVAEPSPADIKISSGRAASVAGAVDPEKRAVAILQHVASGNSADLPAVLKQVQPSELKTLATAVKNELVRDGISLKQAEAKQPQLTLINQAIDQVTASQKTAPEQSADPVPVVSSNPVAAALNTGQQNEKIAELAQALQTSLSLTAPEVTQQAPAPAMVQPAPIVQPADATLREPILNAQLQPVAPSVAPQSVLQQTAATLAMPAQPQPVTPAAPVNPVAPLAPAQPQPVTPAAVNIAAVSQPAPVPVAVSQPVLPAADTAPVPANPAQASTQTPELSQPAHAVAAAPAAPAEQPPPVTPAAVNGAAQPKPGDAAPSIAGSRETTAPPAPSPAPLQKMATSDGAPPPTVTPAPPVVAGTNPAPVVPSRPESAASKEPVVEKKNFTNDTRETREIVREPLPAFKQPIIDWGSGLTRILPASPVENADVFRQRVLNNSNGVYTAPDSLSKLNAKNPEKPTKNTCNPEACGTCANRHLCHATGGNKQAPTRAAGSGAAARSMGA